MVHHDAEQWLYGMIGAGFVAWLTGMWIVPLAYVTATLWQESRKVR